MTTEIVERRRVPRRKTLLGARVIFNERQSTMSCRIRDLDENGARLAFDGPPLVPSEFELRVEQRDEKRRARRVWTKAREMGIEFE